LVPENIAYCFGDYFGGTFGQKPDFAKQIWFSHFCMICSLAHSRQSVYFHTFLLEFNGISCLFSADK